MPKSAPLQSNFTGGEVSPYAQGRVDQPWYKKSMATCLNGIPMIQGAWTRRPGTKYIAEVSPAGHGFRMIPFAPRFGSACMLVLEGGSTAVTFYNTSGFIGRINAQEAFSAAELPQVRYVQNGAYIYFFHPNHPPSYLGDSSLAGYPTVAGSLFLADGPYLDSNVIGNGFALSATTLTLGANTPGTGISLVASAVGGINNGAGFLVSDVGRLVRLNPTFTGNGTGIWCWCVITGFTNSTHVTVTLEGPDPTATTATQAWAMGVYTSLQGGQPGCGTIHEGRLVLSGAVPYPRRFDASSLDQDINQSPTRLTFSPTEFPKGVVTDSKGLDFTLASKDSQNTVWMEADERGLLMGTTGDEWTVRPDTLSGAITPTNIDAKPGTFFGSAPHVAPCKVGKGIVFVQRSTLKVREMYFAFDINGYRAPDRTLWAEHITGTSGIIEMAHQREPQSIVWAARADGTICAMTHEEIDGEITTGWHRHVLGVAPAVGNSQGGSCQVTGVATLPSVDTTKDEVWFLTTRVLDTPGVAFVYLEVIQPISNQYIADADQCFLDLATVVTNGSPSTLLTGLSLYEGVVVTVWADGAPYGQFLVTGGQITLPVAVSKAIVGFDYNSDGQMLRLEAGAADGTALGKIRRTHKVGLVLQQTLGMQIGMSFDNLTPLTFRTQDTPPSVAQPSYSGIRVEEIDADYDKENQFSWRVNGGAPCTVLAVCPRMDTYDAE